MPRQHEIIIRNRNKAKMAIKQQTTPAESLMKDVPKRLEEMIKILYILSEQGKRKTAEFEIVKKAFESNLEKIDSKKQLKATESFLKGKTIIPGLNLFEIKRILNQKLSPDLTSW